MDGIGGVEYQGLLSEDMMRYDVDLVEALPEDARISKVFNRLKEARDSCQRVKGSICSLGRACVDGEELHEVG